MSRPAWGGLANARKTHMATREIHCGSCLRKPQTSSRNLVDAIANPTGCHRLPDGTVRPDFLGGLGPWGEGGLQDKWRPWAASCIQRLVSPPDINDSYIYYTTERYYTVDSALSVVRTQLLLNGNPIILHLIV